MPENTNEAEMSKPGRRRRMRRFLFTGLATLLPTLLTTYIIYVCYQFVHTNLGYWLATILAKLLGQWDPTTQSITNSFTVFAGDIMAVLVVLGIAISLGALAASFVGRRVMRAGEGLLTKMPFVKVIYPYVKQVTDFFLSDKRSRFRTVVAVPYPRRGVYSIGFVTGLGMRSINDRTRQEMIHVFIPSSPTPITGYVVFVPRSEVIELSMTVDQALRFAVSGGVIVPPHQLVSEELVSRDTAMLALPNEPPADDDE